LNYLAHAYLSFKNPKILVGNMISDSVKGKAKYDHESLIFEGINLHRKIDSYTDKHLATKKAMELFKPQIGLYAGAFVDIVYDYFLANDTSCFASNEELFIFSDWVYKVLEKEMNILPERFIPIFEHMKLQNWLYNYKNYSGIELSFKGLTKRAKYINLQHRCFDIFIKNETYFKEFYTAFFNDLKQELNYYIQTNSIEINDFKH
jgi:acyl carrier protein phosphodiesterase